jgi:predicted  nucleic acid-binding Zn-ribbon protein
MLTTQEILIQQETTVNLTSQISSLQSTTQNQSTQISALQSITQNQSTQISDLKNQVTDLKQTLQTIQFNSNKFHSKRYNRNKNQSCK